MSWQNPKLNWSAVDGVKADDLNRIEGNLKHLYDNENGAKRPATLIVGTTASGHLAGAVDFLCDGAADQETINAAIAALPSSGGKIIILDGMYNLNASISVDKPNIIIEGCGDSTIFNSAVASIVTVSATYCSINKISFIGNDSANQEGISVATAATYCTVANCIFADIDIAIKISGLYCRVLDNRVTRSGLYGISVQGSYATIKNNLFSNCLISIRVYYASGAIIIGNTIHASGAVNGYGINLINADTCVVSNNIVRSAHVGIEVYKYPAGSTFSTVDSNLVIGCTNGIQLSNAHDNSISCNLVQNEAYTATSYSMYISGSNKNAINCNRLIGKTYNEVMSTGNGYTGNLTS